jgi:methionyl-tRNA formyltransferase
MNIVFIGASIFGLKCLEKCRTISSCSVATVITAPQKFSISYRPEGVKNVLYADIKGYCKANGIPCEEIMDGMKDLELSYKVKSLQPDAFIVAGWYHMIPKSWRDIAPAYGLHASLLPDYSGGAPLVWAIINGEEKTGITFFQFSDGVDNGPIVGQKETCIGCEDTIKTLYDRVEVLGIDLLKEYLPKLANGTVVLKEQDETKRRLFPQRSPEDGLIDWSLSAKRIYDFIRAQTKPYPGAFTKFRGKLVRLWSSLEYSSLSYDLGIGEFLYEANCLFVGCGDGKVLRIIDFTCDVIDTHRGTFKE